MSGIVEEGIISIYNTDISQLLSINQISKKLHKAYPHINRKVTTLIKAGVFKKIVIGRSYLCSLNLKNDMAVSLLTLNEIKKKEKFLLKNRQVASLIPVLEKIVSEFKVYHVSFSGGRLVFVLDYLNDREAIKTAFPQILKANPEFYDRASFLRMLTTNPAFLREKVILYSFEKYYEFLREIEPELRRNTIFG